MLPDAASYIYDECLASAEKPTADTLRRVLPQLFSQAKNLSLVVDGIDEIAPTEHKFLLQELLQTGKAMAGTKLLIISQDLPTISSQLRKLPKFSMNEEQQSIQNDMKIIIESALDELQDLHEGAVPEHVLADVKQKILHRAEGRPLFGCAILTESN